MELFRERAHVVRYKDGLFLEPSWLAVYFGQRIQPRHHDPLADRLPLGNVQRELQGMKTLVRRAAESLPSHAAFIARYCGGTAAT
jgi:tryptophan halogenase